MTLSALLFSSMKLLQQRTIKDLPALIWFQLSFHQPPALLAVNVVSIEIKEQI
jgi:hypothetical protein